MLLVNFREWRPLVSTAAPLLVKTPLSTVNPGLFPDFNDKSIAVARAVLPKCKSSFRDKVKT
jgi:hypothetical protein